MKICTVNTDSEIGILLLSVCPTVPTFTEFII